MENEITTGTDLADQIEAAILEQIPTARIEQITRLALQTVQITSGSYPPDAPEQKIQAEAARVLTARLESMREWHHHFVTGNETI
jgi:hypothetical protein